MEYQYVFVCGLHRSGTSVLARSLRNHPQVAGFEGTGAVEDEGQFLQTVYLPAFHYGGAGLFGLDPRSHLDETSPLASAENADKLRAQWARYWDASCPVRLEKSPPNLVRTRYLQSVYPNARFVVILRHPIAVSLATKKRGGIPLFSLIEHWLVCHERFLADLGHLNQVHVLWYEDLVAQPVETMAEIWRFLGLEGVPLSEALQSHNDAYFDRWAELRQLAWGQACLGWICRRFETRAGRFGYSLVEPGALNHGSLAAREEGLPRASLLSRFWSAGMAGWEWVNRGPLRVLRERLHAP
jgi:hypothetical protein